MNEAKMLHFKVIVMASRIGDPLQEVLGLYSETCERDSKLDIIERRCLEAIQSCFDKVDRSVKLKFCE